MALNICLNCFSEKDNDPVCQHCGWTEGTAPEQINHLHPGVVLEERYIVGTVIGFGGFGIIYKAWDIQLAKLVALKEFFPAGLVSRVPGNQEIVIFESTDKQVFRTALDRFLEEAKSIARFSDSPNIINILNYFEASQTAYIVMEFLEGLSLREYLQQNDGKLSINEAKEIIRPVMQGLKAIHKAGIVHRDIHPGNIFITTSNQIKILDFGAAKLSTGDLEKTLTVVVTQGYASPEQYRSKSKQGPYTDIYGLGATLYKMITGILPDEAPDRQVNDTLKKPSELVCDVGKNLDKAVMRALSINPDLRFKTVNEMEKAIFENGQTDLPETLLKKRRVRRAFIGTLISLVAIALIVSIVLVNTVLKPLPSLATTEIEPDSISVWVSISNDEAEAVKQTETWSAIEESFESENSSIDIQFRMIPDELYEEEISNAFSNGNMPTLFQPTSTLNFEEAAAPLDLLYRSLNMEDYLYIGETWTEGSQPLVFPSSFRVLVGYENEHTTETQNVSIANAIENYNELLDIETNITIDEEALPLALTLFDSSLRSNTGGPLSTSNSQVAEDLEALNIQDTEQTPISLLESGSVGFYLSTTDSIRAVQTTLPGYYKIIPITNEGVYSGEFTNLFSVSLSSSENQQNASMLFLAFLLNPSSQNRLFLQNDNGLPLNKSAFEEFQSVNSEIGEIENLKLDTQFFQGASNLHQKELTDF